MAVPGRRNGLIDDEDDEEIALFEEDGVFPQPDSDVPPHLRHLAAAAEQGDADALRQALGTSLSLSLALPLFLSLITFYVHIVYVAGTARHFFI